MAGRRSAIHWHVLSGRYCDHKYVLLRILEFVDAFPSRQLCDEVKKWNSQTFLSQAIGPEGDGGGCSRKPSAGARTSCGRGRD